MSSRASALASSSERVISRVRLAILTTTCRHRCLGCPPPHYSSTTTASLLFLLNIFGGLQVTATTRTVTQVLTAHLQDATGMAHVCSRDPTSCRSNASWIQDQSKCDRSPSPSLQSAPSYAPLLRRHARYRARSTTAHTQPTSTNLLCTTPRALAMAMCIKPPLTPAPYPHPFAVCGRLWVVCIARIACVDASSPSCADHLSTR